MNASTTVNRNPIEAPPAPADRFVVVREMLANLENITLAGQRHVMGKIIRFVEAEASHPPRPMRARDRLAFGELFAGLRQEAARVSPDVPSFVRRAEALISLLGAMA